jgi:hypothetical protein
MKSRTQTPAPSRRHPSRVIERFVERPARRLSPEENQPS